MNVVDLIEAIRKRPLFFLLNYSIFEFDAFVRGYRFYQFSHKIEKTEEDKLFEEFKNEWLISKFNLDVQSTYLQYLMLVSNNSSEALDKFFEYWDEFRKQQQ